MKSISQFKKVITDWVQERAPIEKSLPFLTEKSVPVHKHSLWYYFGGATLFLFAVQVATGLLLLFYYQPTPSSAYESVRFIMTQVRFGWLVRSVHSWSANMMIGAMFIHMFSVFFTKAYRKPRELTWLSGMGLFFIVLGFGFSGYLLPWNTLAFFATKVGTEIAGVTPFVGKWILLFLRGSEDVTGATLSRFFAIHVGILPAIVTLLLGAHLLFVQMHGMSKPIEDANKISDTPSEKKKTTIPFIPNFILRESIVWLLVFCVLITLATIFPWELGEKADPFSSAPAGIKPEWYFTYMFQTLKYIPAKIFSIDGDLLGIMAFGLGFLLWTLTPFWDRKSSREQKNIWVAWIGWIIVIYISVMTFMAYRPSPMK